MPQAGTSNGKWKNRPLDPDYLLDTGLLFEINHQILHLLGMALSVKQDDKGNKSFVLLDSRQEPEKATFDASTLEAGTRKMRGFMLDFGAAQLERRRNKLGWACQPKPAGT